MTLKEQYPLGNMKGLRALILAVELVAVEQCLRDTLRKVRAVNLSFDALKFQLDQLKEKTNG